MTKKEIMKARLAESQVELSAFIFSLSSKHVAKIYT